MGNNVKVPIGTAYEPPQSRQERRAGDGSYQHFRPAPTPFGERLQERLLEPIVGPFYANRMGDRIVTAISIIGVVVVLALLAMGVIQ